MYGSATIATLQANEIEPVPGKIQPLAGCRVLLIEDEYFIADDMRDALEGAGARVIGPIATLSEALHQVAEDGFDLAIVDINLRDEMSYSVADALKAEKLPFLFATGYEANVIPERFAGTVRCEKPYVLSDVLMSLKRLITPPSASRPV